MCGIFGVISADKSKVKLGRLSQGVIGAILESERRGKDSSGVLSIMKDEVIVAKSPNRAKYLVKTEEFKQTLMSSEESLRKGDAFAFFGHTRMATHGSAESEVDNQPVIKDQRIILHNGIIINCDQIYRTNPELKRTFEVDSEVFLSLVDNYHHKGLSEHQAVVKAFSQCKGANTFVYFSLNSKQVFFITSNGSLYFAADNEHGLFIFASEKQTLDNLLSSQEYVNKRIITQQLSINQPMIVSLESGKIEAGIEGEDRKFDDATIFRVLKILPSGKQAQSNSIKTSSSILVLKPLEHFYEKIQDPKQNNRCASCLLPTNYPFLTFNDKGLCSFCTNYVPFPIQGIDRLRERILQNRDSRSLLPISGGRDSCYALHLANQELGLTPVAFTYDWGFVTDVARRNISRMCGELGVEHILVAADLEKKRSNVRMNVVAWLKKPNLGMVPLFMAGDKTFFHHASLIKKELDLPIALFGMNRFEPAGFKTGFAGIAESKRYAKTFDISKINKLKLLSFYASQSITNPRYLNSSLVDSLAGLYSYYFAKMDYLQVFDYIPWKEEEVIRTLQDLYGWEGSTDSKNTWRIGDASAPFYNYLYLYFAGFTENDVYLSNLIRDGQISRAQALVRLQEYNPPDSSGFIKYCDLIGLDAQTILDRVHSFKGFADSFA